MKRLFLAALLAMTVSPSLASEVNLRLQCDGPRNDIFTYRNGHASVDSDQYNVVGFDQEKLRAVMYSLTEYKSALDIMWVFTVDFANPAVTEQRIGPNTNVSFTFEGCRRLN
jgi:hypothetical protein